MMPWRARPLLGVPIWASGLCALSASTTGAAALGFGTSTGSLDMPSSICWFK